MVMKTRSLWIIRLALTVQLLGVLAVPALVASGRVELDLSGVKRVASTIDRALELHLANVR